VLECFLRKEFDDFYVRVICLFLGAFTKFRKAVTFAVLYSQLWPLWLYQIFPHYLIHSSIFGKRKVIELKMCVLIFCFV